MKEESSISTRKREKQTENSVDCAFDSFRVYLEEGSSS